MADFYGSVFADTITPTSVSAFVSGPLFGRPSDADDRIFAAQDNDTVDGGGGADLIYGGWNDDLLRGGDGGDVIYGEDYLRGPAQTGNDTIFGGAGNDTLYANDAAIFTLAATGERNHLFGDGGNDLLVGTNGIDTLEGGAGSDRFIVSNSLTVVRDTSTNRLTDINRVETYVDFTIPEGIDDLFAATRGIHGGVLLSEHSLALTLRGNGQANEIRGYHKNDTLHGGDGFDTLRGQDGDDVLYGDAGDDWLYGGWGADILDGGTGFDVMDGGAGNDVYFVGSVSDSVLEQDLTADGGRDTVVTSIDYALDEVRTTGVEDVTATGGGAIAITGNGRGNRLYGTQAANALTGLGGDDLLKGYGGDDSLSGGAGRDTLDGGDGADTIDGGGGGGDLLGGGGNDIYVLRSGDAATETDFTATGGYDQVYAYMDYGLGQGVEMLSMMVAGTGSGNVLSNFMQALSGAPTKLTGFGGDDTLKGGAANDTLEGGDGRDVLEGWEGDNVMSGGSRGDILGGLSGRDTLTGGSGADLLVGGGGADRFRYLAASESNATGGIDTIRGGNGASAFEGAGVSGGDVIDLSAIDANTATPATNDAFRFGVSGAGGLTLASVSGDTMIYGNTDTDADFEFVLMIEDGTLSHTAYRASDFAL